MSNELHGWQIEQSNREDGKVRRGGFLECFMGYILNVWIGWLSQWLWSCLCICNGEWRKNFFTCLEEPVLEETEANSSGGSCLLHNLLVWMAHLPWQSCTLKINPIHYLLKLLHRSFTLFSWKNKEKFFTLSEQALTAIIPKATDILVSIPLHINIEEARINPPQLQKERERNEFCMRSIWSVCLLSDLISADHRWYLTPPLPWWPCNGGNNA